MRIAIALPAYHRPLGLLTTLRSLRQLESGKHEVIYRVGLDQDDLHCIELLRRFNDELGAQYLIRPAAPSLGQKVNDLLQGVHADLYGFMADDVIPLMKHWDDGMHHVLEQFGVQAFSWHELQDSGTPTYPFITRELLTALGGKMFPELFPYWFIDCWLDEVHTIAFGARLPVISDMPLGGKRGKTSGGVRDLRFWFEFFAATRPMRIQQAVAVASFFGERLLPELDRAEQLEQLEETDREQLARVPELERRMGVPKDAPSARYMTVKANAERLLAGLEAIGKGPDHAAVGRSNLQPGA